MGIWMPSWWYTYPSESVGKTPGSPGRCLEVDSGYD